MFFPSGLHIGISPGGKKNLQHRGRSTESIKGKVTARNIGAFLTQVTKSFSEDETLTGIIYNCRYVRHINTSQRYCRWSYVGQCTLLFVYTSSSILIRLLLRTTASFTLYFSYLYFSFYLYFFFYFLFYTYSLLRLLRFLLLLFLLNFCFFNIFLCFFLTLFFLLGVKRVLNTQKTKP